MKCTITAGDIFLTTLQTRMPFKYGIATMTTTPHAFVRMQVDIDGSTFTGCAADHLPPKWFTKDPKRSLPDEVSEMLRVVEHAVKEAHGLSGGNGFDVWRQLFHRQDTWGKAEKLPPLLVHFGTSLVERALIETCCRQAQIPFWTMLREGRLGVDLGTIHSELDGLHVAELLPKQPLSRVRARHTVGLSDPIIDNDIQDGERLDDGLPQSLVACIRRYGLRHFKIKISGDVTRDIDRLKHIASVLQSETDNFRVSLDGNEQFHSVPEFVECWTSLRQQTDLLPIFERLMFVEQPFHRDIALDESVMNELATWTDRPLMIIDESDGELSSLPQALRLGYTGTSHKNCKGVFKGIANACLLAYKNRRQNERRHIMSGEDLVNIGPIALLQDLAVCAALGIESVERNGHHYFAGLSMFPKDVQELIRDNHGDLYVQSDHGWPCLAVRDGSLSLASVNEAPFGVRPIIPVEHFTPAADWRYTDC